MGRGIIGTIEGTTLGSDTGGELLEITDVVQEESGESRSRGG